MIGAFKPRMVAFYGGTVIAVIALFTVATEFGETHLTAPPAIDGQYAIAGGSLPGCLSAQSKVLQINQSGIFVNGALLPAQASEAMIQSAAKRPPLTGRFDHENIWLKGTMPHIAGCKSAVTIQGKIQGSTLTGTLQLIDPPTRTVFQAEREAHSGSQSTH